MPEIPESTEPFIYSESVDDPALAKRRKGTRDTLRVWVLVPTICFGSSAIIVWENRVFGLVFLGMGLLGALDVWMRWRRLVKIGYHSITGSRFFGPEVREDGLPVTLIESVYSYRYSSQTGSFVFHLKDRTRVKVAASSLADPDSYWEATKLLLPRSGGWEWVDGVKGFRKYPFKGETHR